MKSNQAGGGGGADQSKATIGVKTPLVEHSAENVDCNNFEEVLSPQHSACINKCLLSGGLFTNLLVLKFSYISELENLFLHCQPIKRRKKKCLLVYKKGILLFVLCGLR